jgi:ABC-type lipoprotein release transport system permease subunit
MDINWLAAIVAGIAAFVIGGVWYSPVLFAKAWQREAAVTDEAIRTSNQGLIFGLALVLLVVAAVVFAMFLGPRPSLQLGVGAGFAAGLAWVAAGLGVTYLFERRSLKLFVINGAYLTLAFTVIGLVLALWH